MKTKINSLLVAALALFVLILTANAATEVYDLKTDWNPPANPNGPWSYRGGDMLLYYYDDGFFNSYWDIFGNWLVMRNSILTPDDEVYLWPFYREQDLPMLRSIWPDSGFPNITWKAPEAGTISISGAV
jgi:hypothetical protein